MGGIVITNFAIDERLATHLLTSFESKGKRRLIDSVVCPAVTTEAIDALKRFKGKCRVFVNPALADINRNSLDVAPLRRPVRGGMLIQPNYTFVLNLQDERLQKLGPAATLSEEMDMLLAWAIGSTSTSNTITLVKNSELIGNGVGQQDRVGACKLAVKRAKEAGHQANGASAYSDSFFPFADGPDVLRKAGVRAILSSSGSKNDYLTIEYCEDRKVSLYHIPDSDARGFYGN
jgi:phosphoribosylaminoimidazolecarboxamide formyltransferase/IMP cyclohydrolase